MLRAARDSSLSALNHTDSSDSLRSAIYAKSRSTHETSFAAISCFYEAHRNSIEPSCISLVGRSTALLQINPSVAVDCIRAWLGCGPCGARYRAPPSENLCGGLRAFHTRNSHSNRRCFRPIKLVGSFEPPTDCSPVHSQDLFSLRLGVKELVATSFTFALLAVLYGSPHPARIATWLPLSSDPLMPKRM